MNTTSQFTSSFWHYYISIIVILSFIGLTWLLLSQNKTKAPPKGEETETMGHSWDGIEEYNNPLPRWWFFMFVGTMIFGVGYFILYPGMGDYKGLLGWTSQNQYEKEIAAADEKYKPIYAKFANMPVEQVAKDPQAQRIGKNLYDTYCIQCHGSDAKGAKGFPNLTDHDWLWGGEPKQISETIKNGRIGVMVPWGPALGEERVKDVANYVMSLSGKTNDEERSARGKSLFMGPPANCFTCHGEQGKGVLGLGPNLTDDVWLWGGSEKSIIETITNGRHNQMPAWDNFLDKDKMHIMTAYVWGLSNNKGNAAPIPVADTAAASVPAPVNAVDEASVSFEKGIAKFYFATAKSDVATGADVVTTDLLKAGKDGKKLVISGFADSTGNVEANAELSKKRAVAVQAFLVAQGVDIKNIELRKPESSTGAVGDSAEGRRVEVKIEG